MESEEREKGKNTTMTVRLPSEVGEKLEALARGTKRSKAYLAGEAIAAFVERNAWQVARIKAALEEAQSGRPGVPHEEVEEWMDSWDTDQELARPTPEP
jgi:predicted transcriptional regulator